MVPEEVSSNGDAPQPPTVHIVRQPDGIVVANNLVDPWLAIMLCHMAIDALKEQMKPALVKPNGLMGLARKMRP